MQRVAFTEPFTIRERMSIKWAFARYDVRRFIESGLWQKLAHLLPRRIAYFAYIRVVAHAWAQVGNKHPDELNYGETCDLWMAPKHD